MNEVNLEKLISNIKILKNKEFSFGIMPTETGNHTEYRVKVTNDVVFYSYEEAREIIDAIQNLFREVDN